VDRRGESRRIPDNRKGAKEGSPRAEGWAERGRKGFGTTVFGYWRIARLCATGAFRARTGRGTPKFTFLCGAQIANGIGGLSDPLFKNGPYAPLRERSLGAHATTNSGSHDG
jgi:hypothetical protein